MALLLFADATLKDAMRTKNGSAVTSQRIGLSVPQSHNPIKTLTTASAPAPDMTSEAVLAAQPKIEPKHQATIPAEARAARAEAPPKKARVEVSAKRARAEAPPPNNPDTRPTTYRQIPFFDRFSIKDY